MQRTDERLLLSATDLVGELACEHLTTLELEAVRGERERPFRQDDQLDLIEQRGLEHERAYLERLVAAGKRVVSLEDLPRRTLADLEAAQAATVDAMRGGADVVYQGTLFDGRWRGHPDFLVRVESPSDLGAWSYEVADAKLARQVKASALVQCSLYSDLLAGAQGLGPEELHVVTGDGSVQSHRVADYSAYYRMARRAFEERLGRQETGTYPEPVEHCRVCRWYGACQDQRRKDDHLSRVAGLTRSHAKALANADVPTLTALGAARPETDIEAIAPLTLDRLHHQARLQLRQYADGVVRHELIPPDPDQAGRGLERLPLPSPLDVFLDFESHLWVQEGGLEYLMGTVVEENGGPVYVARWADGLAEEKLAFEDLVDFVAERYRRDPAMHVYHYGAYERAALRRLMGRHATREDEIDGLLRAEVFVDLFEVIRQGIRVSQESYSLKKVEKLYMPKRQGPSTEPGFALAAYERWMRTHEPAIKADILAYNQDDCVSTFLLRSWLEARRPEAEEQFGLELGRGALKPAEPTEELKARAIATRARVDALIRDQPEDASRWTADDRARWLLAQLLEWHRREDKPAWWTYFDTQQSSLEDLVRDSSTLGDLSYVGVVGKVARSLIHRYSYDPRQEHKFHRGKDAIDPIVEKSAGEVWEVDPESGFIDLKRSATSKVPHPRGLIHAKPIPTDILQDGLLRVADHVLAHGLHEAGRYRAGLDLLLRSQPSTRALDAGASVCLPVQGPPGTGKTYSGARRIVELVAKGKRVGIVATTHEAVTNLAEAVCGAAASRAVPVAIVHKRTEDDALKATRDEIRLVFKNPEVVQALESGTAQVVAGTQWLFARPEMQDRLDVLFVDEAGQMSLANVLSMAGAAQSIVLLGDPNQLAQVSQGTHPPGAEASALEHVLDGAPTLRAEQGDFLKETWRMHPRVCGFISDAFYEGRLQSHVSTHGQYVSAGGGAHGTGVRYLPVPHVANAARSREEAERVADLVEALVGRPWTDNKGETRAITAADVVVVAPYNAQVAEIRRQARRRGLEPRVGTVDKFQGQEGAVVIFSMATSSPEDAPRNMEFLFSRNRLNVAISRARALAILVCSPELLRFRCETPAQMRLANAFCRYLEHAEAQDVTGSAPAPVAGPPVQLRLLE
jgi:uncharacterized protein